MRLLFTFLVTACLLRCGAPEPRVQITFPAKPKAISHDQILRESFHQLDMRKIGRQVNRSFRNLKPAIIEYVIAEADRRGISPTLALSLLYQESDGYPFATSPVGALGLMQIMPAHHYAGNPRDLYHDQKLNIRLGIKYLRTCKRITGNEWHAVQAYNTGEGAWLDGIRSTTHAKRVFAIRTAIRKELERIDRRNRQRPDLA